MAKCGLELWPYCIDWPATGAMIGGVGALIGAFAVFYAADNFRSWVRREKFKADRERAIRIAAAFYEGEFILSQIRAPFVPAGEIHDAREAIDGAANIPEENRNFWEQRAVTIGRVNRHEDYWSRLFTLMPEAEAVFGTNVKNALLEILKARQKVVAAAQSYAQFGHEDWIVQLMWELEPTTNQALEMRRSLDAAKATMDELMAPYRSEAQDS